MKLILVVALFVAQTLGAPSDVEIIKQRVVRFPEEPVQHQTSEQAQETQRILEEINKINAALGYVKKEQRIHERHGPTLLDSDTYLYPKPPSAPSGWKFHVSGEYPGAISPFKYQGPQAQYRSVSPSFARYNPSASFQNLRHEAPIARKIVHQHSIFLPQPYDARTYYYPDLFLRAPFKETPRHYSVPASNNEAYNPNLVVSKDITSIVEYAQNLETHDVEITASNEKEFEEKLLDNVHKIVAEDRAKAVKAKSEDKTERQTEGKKSTNVKFIAVPARVQAVPGIIVTKRPTGLSGNSTPKPATQYKPLSVQSKPNTQNKLNNQNQQSAQSQRLPQKQSSVQSHSLLQSQNIAQEQNSPQTQPLVRNEPLAQNISKSIHLKNPLSVILKPFPQFFRRPTTPAPLPQPSQSIDENDDDSDYGDGGDSLESYAQPGEKGIFQQALDNQKEVLKSGGVLIQKLRVRKGGIAIAGPGGVATAGSGGTAIIGPGGVALTHPRSLTIAGPGARIVALPESYDLEKAVWETSARSLPPEGVVVATGPTIYYSP